MKQVEEFHKNNDISVRVTLTIKERIELLIKGTLEFKVNSKFLPKSGGIINFGKADIKKV